MRCNGKLKVEYKMLNKERVIKEIFSEKQKKSSTFLRLAKLNFLEIR